MLRGALLGAMTGLGVTFLNDKDESIEGKKNNQIVTTLLYTLGGVIGGAAIKKLSTKGRKR